MKKIGFLLIMLMAFSVNLILASDKTVVENDSLDLAMLQPKLKAIPDYVFDMTGLRVLDVAFNQIGVISPKILHLKKLETLYLSGNQYLTELPDFLMEMPNLKTIYFEGMGTWKQSKKDEVVQRFASRGIKVILERQYGTAID